MTKGVLDRMVEVERVRDAFHAAIFTAADADAALALATADCELANFPSGRSTSGTDELRRHLTEAVLPYLPADLEFRRLSRTGDRWRVAQEDVVSFTHDREMPWLLPGVAATGRRAEVLAVSVVRVERSSVASCRTLWDHAALIAQLDAG